MHNIRMNIDITPIQGFPTFLTRDTINRYLGLATPWALCGINIPWSVWYSVNLTSINYSMMISLFILKYKITIFFNWSKTFRHLRKAPRPPELPGGPDPQVGKPCTNTYSAPNNHFLVLLPCSLLLYVMLWDEREKENKDDLNLTMIWIGNLLKMNPVFWTH